MGDQFFEIFCAYFFSSSLFQVPTPMVTLRLVIIKNWNASENPYKYPTLVIT